MPGQGQVLYPLLLDVAVQECAINLHVLSRKVQARLVEGGAAWFWISTLLVSILSVFFGLACSPCRSRSSSSVQWLRLSSNILAMLVSTIHRKDVLTI